MRSLILLCLVSASFAIMCYYTEGLYGKVPKKTDAISCPKDVTACLSVVNKGVINGIKIHTSVWTCDYQHNCTAGAPYCSQAQQDNLTATVCCCFTDYCNGIANV